VSERTACQLAGISRTAYRYQAKRCDDEPLRARLKELRVKQSAYGYLLLHGMLKAEGLVKRAYRIYTGEGLQVCSNKRKKLQRSRQPMEVPLTVNQRWSIFKNT